MFGDILYNLFIMPLEMIIEFIFSVAYKISQNPGLSIICVSLAVNFLSLPLYKRADKMQSIERDKQAEMKPFLDHIKKVFKGDKRYMITQTYYRQQNYKPIYVLKSSFSLLLQIPFFTAAYHFLSNLGILQESSFWIFSNLGEPDQLIHIGSVTLNLLPILMTAINIVSGAIYTKGFALKDKLQLYAVALIFLVLLYNSPSGLVFYWTLNNVFSLLKNIVMKFVPERKEKEEKECKLLDKKVFFAVNILLTLFVGLYIPLTIVVSSPQEFIGDGYGPMWLVINTLSVMAGFFLVWLSIFYYLGNNKVKNVFIYVVWAILGIGLVSYFAFGNSFGTMTSMLTYSTGTFFGNTKMKIISLLVSLVVAAVFIFIVYKWPKVVRKVCAVLILTCVGLAIYNTVPVCQSVSKVEAEGNVDVEEKIVSLSKTKKNTVIIVLDKAINSYIPRIIEEKPELKASLDGFCYYPNTVSYGCFTNFSTPSMYGGYDYTPQEINDKPNVPIRDKHNDALLVLPTLFDKADYDITICDPPYAGDYA